MKNKELISIIIPTYNRAKTIKKAVESVLNQTYENIEIIIVDDGSTDNTNEIINKISNNKISYYKLKENKGACYARNYGIAKSKGKYIAFQDSDDEWLPNKLSLQIKNMKKNNSSIDFCSYIKTKDGNKKNMPSLRKLIRLHFNGISKELLYGNFISTQLLVFDKKCFEKYRFDENLPRFQDWDLMLTIADSYKISFTKDYLVYTYIQNDSITKSNDKLYKAIDIMLKKNYKNNKLVKSTLYSILAKFSKKQDKRKYYKLSLMYDFRLKNLIKLIIKY